MIRIVAPRQLPGGHALVVLTATLGLALAGCGAEPRPSPSATAPPSLVSSAAPTPASEDARVTGVLVAGDVPRRGELGTWTLDGAGSDSPWLPWSDSKATSIAQGVPFTIRLADRSPIGWWFVDFADASDISGGNARRLGGREVDAPPLGSVQLEALPAGRWVVAARLFRADGRGDGVTYWSVLAAR